MNIKCLFNKHKYVPIQYVDETTDYEWTYIVHCSRCHKESVHDMNEKAREIDINTDMPGQWRLIPSSNGTEAYEELDIEWYIVNFTDDFVLYSGNLQNCYKVLEQNYQSSRAVHAGLQIVSYQNLTKQMKLELQVHDDV